MMAGQKSKKLYRWEIALLMGVAAAMVFGTYLSGSQAALAQRVVRLHVVGGSDSGEDQTVKLGVRDAVLAEAGPLLEGVSGTEEARAVLAANLGRLAAAGAAASAGAAVTASVEDGVWFPTKEYEDFSLPAGRYPAVRIVVGEGDGRNWWCVVFPQLCLTPVSEKAGQKWDGLSTAQVGLITGENQGYMIKFRLLEWWGEWMG